MDQLFRGTGIAVASSIEATDVGIGRSFDEDEDDDRREDAGSLDGVRERASRRTGVREARFGGMTTGMVFVDSKWAMLSGAFHPSCLSLGCSLSV